APHNLVTRSVESSSGSPGRILRDSIPRPDSHGVWTEARHGRGAFTTETRGGLSQWSGGRLGSYALWLGPLMAIVLGIHGASGFSSGWKSSMRGNCSRRASGRPSRILA